LFVCNGVSLNVDNIKDKQDPGRETKTDTEELCGYGGGGGALTAVTLKVRLFGCDIVLSGRLSVDVSEKPAASVIWVG
jgi:hypothetical protein